MQFGRLKRSASCMPSHFSSAYLNFLVMSHKQICRHIEDRPKALCKGFSRMTIELLQKWLAKASRTGFAKVFFSAKDYDRKAPRLGGRKFCQR